MVGPGSRVGGRSGDGGDLDLHGGCEVAILLLAEPCGTAVHLTATHGGLVDLRSRVAADQLTVRDLVDPLCDQLGQQVVDLADEAGVHAQGVGDGESHFTGGGACEVVPGLAGALVGLVQPPAVHVFAFAHGCFFPNC